MSNRPPTDQEKAIIQESMASTSAKLNKTKGRVSGMVAHIEAPQSQVQQAESELRLLREEEAAISVKLENHSRVLAPFEIFQRMCSVTFSLHVYRTQSLLCLTTQLHCLTWLAQISAGMRHIALTTPIIWARMDIQIREHHGIWDKTTFLNLARRVKEWFNRSGELPLTLFMEDPSNGVYTTVKSIPSIILLDALFSYSARWKNVQLKSDCDVLSAPVLRLAALTNADVPLLQSVALSVRCFLPSSVLSNIVFLKASTLRHVSLFTTRRPKYSRQLGSSHFYFAQRDQK